VGPAVILQRGRHVETAKAPEHRPFHRRHNRSFTNCLGVDAERNSDRVRREKSRRESDRPGESFPTTALDRLRDLPELLDVAKGLNYLHANRTTHGDLNGAGIFFRPFRVSLITLC
jgi:hypothetical protein